MRCGKMYKLYLWEMQGPEKMRLEKKMQNESEIIKVEIRVLKTGFRSRSEVCMISTVRMLPGNYRDFS